MMLHKQMSEFVISIGLKNSPRKINKVRIRYVLRIKDLIQEILVLFALLSQFHVTAKEY